MTTLAELQEGQEGVVSQVTGTDEISTRLMEMGLTPGIVVRFMGTAPLGDPREYQIRGYRLSLRKAEAERVILRS